MKRSLFRAAVASILLYGCTTWTLTKRLKKKLDGNYTRMLRAILNKSWRKNPTRHKLYGHLPPITKTIQVRRGRHAGHSWRSRDELISDVLLWTPTHGSAKAGRPARTYIQQLCEDTGCCPEDLPEAMNQHDMMMMMNRDVDKTPTTFGITVTFMFYSFFSFWLDPSICLSFYHFLSVVAAKSAFWLCSFTCWLIRFLDFWLEKFNSFFLIVPEDCIYRITVQEDYYLLLFQSFPYQR